MTKLWLRRILAVHVAFFILAMANCQFQDDELSSDDANLTEDYEEDKAGKEMLDYIDNRIDETPTFVSPVEKFVRAFAAPFGWISHATNARSFSDRDFNENPNAFDKFFQGVAKPIRNFVGPTRRSSNGGFGDVLDTIGDRFKAVYPGTEWCGAGNVAKNPDEVGLFRKTDTCCKEHDQCNVSLEAGTSEHGLRNNGIFTRSHCLCDAKFYYCLKEARSLIATNIGLTYFNVLRPQCFKQEYPAFCVKYGRTRLRNNKCLDYDYDYSHNKTWQWFDSPDFL